MKKPELRGATYNQVEFTLDGRRVVAWRDGDVRSYDDEACESRDGSAEERRHARTMLRKYLRKQFGFSGRAMKGTGVDR